MLPRPNKSPIKNVSSTSSSEESIPVETQERNEASLIAEQLIQETESELPISDSNETMGETFEETLKEVSPEIPATSNNEETEPFIPDVPEFFKNEESQKGSSNPRGTIYKQDSELLGTPAVEILAGYKHFGRFKKYRQVLSGLNLRVMPGKIYSLIGPRACGKTTVVNIILGRQRLDVGRIQIFGKNGPVSNPLRVGFSPQQLGLKLDFTIMETLFIYGNLMGLPRKTILKRFEQLTRLLVLPLEDKIIWQYSDSCLRKVSFAVAVLHEPELLIIDELTTGVDPVLRHIIWQHIFKMANDSGTTVIVTSSDLAEAEQSNVIGLMRDGALLYEGQSSTIIDSLGSKNLQGAFYAIATSRGENVVLRRSDSYYAKSAEIEAATSSSFMLVMPAASQGFTPSEGEVLKEINVISLSKERMVVRQFRGRNAFSQCMHTWLSCGQGNCRHFRILLSTMMLELLRSPMKLLLLICVPPLYLLLFCFAIGVRPYGLRVGVVNHETNYDDCTTKSVEYSCRLLLNLKDDEFVSLISYEKESDALRAVRDGNIEGFLVVAEDMTTKIKLRMHDNRDIRGIYSDDAKGMILELRMDQTSFLVSESIRITLKEAYLEFVQEVSSDRTYSSSISDPIVAGPMIFGERDNKHSVLVWGALVTIIYMLSAMMGTTSLLDDSGYHVYERLRVIGVSRRTMLSGHLLVWLVVMTLTSLILLISVSLSTDNRLDTDEFLLSWLMLICTAFNGVALSVLLFSIFKDKVVTIKVVVYIMCAIVLLSGIMWPLQALPVWVRNVMYYTPLVASTEALKSLIIRHIDVGSRNIYMGFVLPIVFGLSKYTISTVILSTSA